MDDLQRTALAYLQNHQVMTVASYGPLGLWAAAVFYVNEQFDLYFLSAAQTRHAQNLAANGQTAVTIQEDYKDWPMIQGIQLEGKTAVIKGQIKEHAIQLYQKKYPFTAGNNAQIQAALTRVNWYRVTPHRLYFIDNQKGLGHRDELSLSL